MFLSSFLVFLISFLFFSFAFLNVYSVDINHYSNDLEPHLVSTWFNPYYITYWKSYSPYGWDSLCATDVVSQMTHCSSDCNCWCGFFVDDSNFNYFIVNFSWNFYLFSSYNFGGYGWRSSYRWFIWVVNPQYIFSAIYNNDDYLFIVWSSMNVWWNCGYVWNDTCFGINLNNGSYMRWSDCPMGLDDVVDHAVPFPNDNFVINVFSNWDFVVSVFNGDNYFYDSVKQDYTYFKSSSFVWWNFFFSWSNMFGSSYPSYIIDVNNSKMYSLSWMILSNLSDVYQWYISWFVAPWYWCLYTWSMSCNGSYCDVSYSCVTVDDVVPMSSYISSDSSSWFVFDGSFSNWFLNFSTNSFGCPVSVNSGLDFSIGWWSMFGFKVPEYRPLSSFTCLYSIFVDFYKNPLVDVFSWYSYLKDLLDHKNNNMYFWDMLLFFILFFVFFFYIAKKE